MSALSKHELFHKSFLLDKIADEILRAGAQATPVPPQTTKVSAEGRANYATLAGNSDYGCTALMAMNTWNTACYGQVRPGYIFLFPGTNDSNPPAYQGAININCNPHAPLLINNGVLHAQMCTLLAQSTTNFIGFSVSYPWNGSGAVGYNSSTCNIYWFGSRTVPTNYNGTNWQQIIYNALSAWLP